MFVFNKYSATAYQVERCTNKAVFYEKTARYEAFIRDAIKTIKKGHKAYLYYNYQVDDVKKYFKDQVDIIYNSKFNWWEATLKRL